MAVFLVSLAFVLYFKQGYPQQTETWNKSLKLAEEKLLVVQDIGA